MTVSTTESVVFYDGTGSLAPWPVPFRFFDDTDLAVQKIDANGGQSTLVLGADYSVTGAGNLGGGTVTSKAPLQVGETAIIARVLSPVQETDLRNQGRFFAQIHEDVFDYLTMLIQQNQEGLSRALLRPLGRNYYDAEGRVIANLGDAVNDRDAVNYRTLLRKLAELAADGSGQLVLEALALPSGSDLVGFSAEDFGQPTTTLLRRGRRIILPGDYYTQGAAIEAVKAGRTFLANPERFNLTVGPGGQFSTLALAVAAACRMRPTQGQGLAQCTINLLTGFVLREQILVVDGSDLGWIKITSTDAMVEIDPAYITQALSVYDDSYPAFGALGSTLPVIGCLFQYANNATARDGVAVMLGSSVRFEPGAGVVRARRGLLVFYGSEANCYPLGLTQGGDGTGAGTATGVDFTYARLRALHVAYGSRGNLGRSMLHHCAGDMAVYVIWGSHADLYQSNASYCSSGTAFLCRDGSFLNARESNASHSVRGFHALHNGRINARSRLTGPTMIWVGEGAQHCTQYGALASGNSQIEASELNASFCTGSAGISASDSSSISFYGGKATDCTNRGVWAQNTSKVSAAGADVSRCGNGLIAFSVSQIAANSATGTGCSDVGALAYAGSTIDISGGNFSGCFRGIEPREGSTITARNANLSGCGQRAVSAIDGGTANAQGADCRNSGSRGITARDGGRVAATGADCSGASDWSVEVINGSQITFNGGNAGLSPMNQAANTITGNGIIFYTNSPGPGPSNDPELIAHRGFMGISPQNTPLAFTNAVANGADGLETDVSVSSDGVLYTFHDTTVNALTDGTGTFTSLTSAYLDSLQLLQGIGTENAPLRIGKFSEYLDIAKTNNRKIYPELKRLRSNADVTPIVQAVIDAGMASKCNMSAFQLARLQIVRSLSSLIELGMLSDSSDPVVLTQLVDSMIELGNATMIVNYTATLANPSVVAYALANGVGWASYVVNDLPTVASLNAINVYRIISDYPLVLPAP